MGGDVALAIDEDVVVDGEAGGKVVFEASDDVGLEVALDVGDNRVKVGDKNVDFMRLVIFFG